MAIGKSEHAHLTRQGQHMALHAALVVIWKVSCVCLAQVGTPVGFESTPSAFLWPKCLFLVTFWGAGVSLEQALGSLWTLLGCISGGLL